MIALSFTIRVQSTNIGFSFLSLFHPNFSVRTDPYLQKKSDLQLPSYELNHLKHFFCMIFHYFHYRLADEKKKNEKYNIFIYLRQSLISSSYMIRE